MEEFYEVLFGEREGYLPVITRDEAGSLRRTRWFSWPSESREMFEYIYEHKDEDVYFSPMLYAEPKSRFSATHATKANVVHAPVVYSDADEADPSVFRCEPTISVETSPGRWHLYWVLTDPAEPQVTESLARSVSVAHKEDGADNGWALSKRLRVPNTSNSKRDMIYRVRADMGGPTYTLAEFAAEYVPVDTDPEVEAGEIPDNVPRAAEVLSRVEFDPELMNLYTTPPLKDYSMALYVLELKLFRQGFSKEEVFAVAREAACNKFNRPGRKEADLWRHVLHTAGRYRDERLAEEEQERLAVGALAEEYVEPSAPEVYVGRAETWDDLDLLDPEERESLKQTFIDRYADWCISQSALSARQFHEGAAFMILATILGEFGYVRPSFGEVSLNLYMLVLGETTRSRKSTSKNFMVKVIDNLSVEDGKWQYEVGQDVTPEALTEYLSERPGRSSLYWRDEVQALFEAVKSGGYLRGLFAMLTNAYDGAVDGVLRKTGTTKRTKRTKTNLNFFGMGIMDHVASVVTDEEFQSGYLPRFIWIIDKEAKTVVGSADVEQFDEKRSDVDKTFDRIVADLGGARTRWDRHQNRTGEKQRIMFEPEAWARWQQFTVDIGEHALAHPTRSEVLAAPADRMGITTLKMAALLAMFECRDTVEMHDILTAIHYATEFMKYTEYAARQVSKSQFQKELEELEAVIGSSGKPITYAAALRHFKGRKTLREMNEMIEYLVQIGTVRLHVDGKTKTLEVVG